MTATRLPILDLSHFSDPDERPAFLEQLRNAARDIGFFYLVNHGVDDALQHAVQQEARHFFALSDAEKQQVAMIHSPHFRGYNRAASELTRGQPDWREQFDIGAERGRGRSSLATTARTEPVARGAADAEACPARLAKSNDPHGPQPAARLRPGAKPARRRL